MISRTIQPLMVKIGIPNTTEGTVSGGIVCSCKRTWGMLLFDAMLRCLVCWMYELIKCVLLFFSFIYLFFLREK